ncbi:MULTISPECIES: AAA family ATPase [Pseudescherichia]|uniref:AAA family ATPase n=1 Tax=Pseudescherichia TaxID=2055880 RepID=UPI001EE13658|nr:MULTISPECIES: AAA family ATPase [Pseudescherichia]
MSIAGIRSNRGDVYQTLVAFDWALKVLSDDDYQWLEVDSVNYSVDDVVIGKRDGTLIACQCKKNQTDFSAWSAANLGDEIDKTAYLLVTNPNASVRFYSRNNFGELAKLKEHCITQPDEHFYQKSLGKAHQTLDNTLSKKIKKTAPTLSTFEFLSRTSFFTSDDLDRMVELLYERLRNIATNAGAAFYALWTRLDLLGARLGDGNLSTVVQHRLTKEDLKNIIQQVGATLVPPMDISEIRHSFSNISAIGRSWRRDIAGQRIANPVVDEILAAISDKKRSILLTGLPGSGKTCVMLALQDALEEQAKTNTGIVPFFIQSREFADLATPEQRQAMGLSDQWVEKAARLADDAHVVVVIDSLDVLSIARDHRVLTYFLAQIDRLLLIPNLTVVTACRDFDRHYDRKIAERQWDCEVQCQSLDWNTDIAPLLDMLGVETTAIDAITRELIKNPRELALFVELAQRDGSFSVVTSQALAQRYLDTIIRADGELGDEAIQAIEDIASKMLLSRSLAVPYQRFTASQDIQRKLCSLNVLQETQDRKLTFGHQTLLDVLVISGAMRSGITLNEFIRNLSPVPFVRPSIRSFVAQLALGERREFRKQVRAVLAGNAAFHIRRLVAESFAEQLPQDEDWPLIRGLREKHRDVFQIIYASAINIQWHYFWLTYLIPYLKNMRDTTGLAGHVHRISQWSNTDTAGVLSFWDEVLSIHWFDGNEIVNQIIAHLCKIKSENFTSDILFFERLLTMPQYDHSLLGRVIAKCMTANIMDDAMLWSYIKGDISEEDIVKFNLNNKLRCQPYEFGDQENDFILERMVQSNSLLDLALESIESWSNVRALHYGKVDEGYRNGFLNETSYDDAHSQDDINHIDSINILFNAVEAAIINQAKLNTYWWKRNRERLSLNTEGALLYFGILACTASPEENIDLIGLILCEPWILESELSYELGNLLQTAFTLLSVKMQDAVMHSILNIHNKHISNELSMWRLRSQAGLIAPIPCYLRSPEAQAVIDLYEKRNGVLIIQPYVFSRSGTVQAPFSFEVFLDINDNSVLQLLLHYDGHSSRDWDDFLIGGEREVGWQIREASSRNPSRFLYFLSTYWESIPDIFRSDIMDGIVTYLVYRYGNLSSNAEWRPVEEPQAHVLASQIIDELERHPQKWRNHRSTAKALEACANVIVEKKEADRLIFLAIGFATFFENDPITGDSVGLLDLGLNMVKGNIADALMIITNNFQAQGNGFPELLIPTLRRFASDEHPATRAMILRRLPYLQSKNFNLGWELFHIAMENSLGLWKIAEQCLYYAYYAHFETVQPLLKRLRCEGQDKDVETWGRISALSALHRHNDFAEFLLELKMLQNNHAWRGAATVWTNPNNIRQHSEQCFNGIESGLNAGNLHAQEVVRKMNRLFFGKDEAISIPIELLKKYVAVFEKDNDGNNKRHIFFGFHEWLNAMAQQNPENALAATEIYLAYVSRTKAYLYDHGKSLAQLMTRLFAEAEEIEEIDSGTMLHRVVAVQDTLLSLGVEGVAEWLKAAERP